SIALDQWPSLAPARDALAQLTSGGSPKVELVPALVRPWGDGEAMQLSLDRFAQVQAAMSSVRVTFQSHFLALLGAVGSGPLAKPRPHGCPFGELAPSWKAAQDALAAYERLGVELETEYRFLERQ